MTAAPRVFGVDYQFLACGDVFTQGLVHAAAALGVPYAHASCRQQDLDIQIVRHRPDLVLVVHGRTYSPRSLPLSKAIRSAVWLLDEPYEVDDTSRWSGRFDHVFVNDPNTLDRHQHASYLPVCYDPVLHTLGTGPRPHTVGFIGGGNRTRDRYLAALARAGVLSYVVGGAWASPEVQRRCLAPNIPPAQTAALYQQTQIIVNVFREQHHYNRDHVPASSLNPRVYEALACGALVVSEWRPEADTLLPELPTFRSEQECVDRISHLLAHPVEAEAIRLRCAVRINHETYARRLATVLEVAGLRRSGEEAA